jgi:DNA-binding MarR family transcriptional regulator
MDVEDLKAFGALGERLGLQLHSTDVQVMTILAGRLAGLEMTPARATAVVYIALHEGCDQVTLGRALGINRATTMKLVDALEARGAIERRAGRDRRTNALHLTAAGLTLRGEIERVTLDHDKAMFGRLSAAEQDELSRLLAKLRQNDSQNPSTQRVLQATA